MLEWRVSEPYINLWLHDIPLNYQPAKGPPIVFELNYKLRDEGNTENFYPFSPGWVVSFFSFASQYKVEDSASGEIFYTFPTGSDVSDISYRNNTKLQRYRDLNGNITSYTVYYRDGSKDIFSYKASSYGHRLTERYDPQGNKITINYSSNVLTSITDADGNSITFYYEDTNFPSQVTKITAPGSREVHFAYDSNGKLNSIQDVEGITSAISYDGTTGRPTSITTPYGTTSFYIQDLSSHVDRSLTVVHPDGTKEAYALVDVYPNTDMPASFSSNQLPTGTPYATMSYPYGTLDTAYRRERNTFYWNRYQFSTLSSTNMPSLGWSDLKKARVRHWLWVITELGYSHVDTLGNEQAPSPDGSTEGQVTWYDYSGKSYSSPEIAGTQILPTVIARVQPDTTTWYLYQQRNSIGKVTTLTEKWTSGGSDYTRQNVYTYSTDLTDLVEHRGPNNERVVGYAYNAGHPHVPVTATNALGELTTYTYDTSGNGHRLLTVTTPSGLLSTLTYGTDGRIKHIIDSASGTPIRTNGFSWTGDQLATHTNALTLKRTFTWDKLNRLTRVDFPDSTYTASAYTNGAGTKILQVGASRDRLGNTNYFAYNSLQQLTDIQDPLGRITHYDYCACGSPEYIKRAYGTGIQLTTQNVFDYQGNILQTLYPGSVAVTNYYDALRRLTKTTDFLSTNTYTYDNLNRLLTVANAVFGQVKANAYDIEDRATSSTDQNGLVVSMTYDDLDRLRTRTYPDSGIEAFGYTANISGPTSYTNQISKVTTWAYDANGRTTAEIIVGIMTNTFAYDPSNNLLTLTDGNSHNTTWEYDFYSQVLYKKDNAGTSILTNTFDANGRLATRWSKAKGTTSYTYDNAGSLTAINYPASTDITYTYDALNRLSTMIDAVGTTSFTYASNGQLATEDGPWNSDTVTDAYNSAGLRSSLTITQPTSTWSQTYDYDAARRLTNVTTSAGSYKYYFHSGLGGITAATRLIEQLTLPNTSFIANSFDTSARLTGTDLKNSSSTTLNKHAYVYNTANQRTKQTFTDGGYFSYLYNDAGELYSSISTNSSGTEVAAERFGYALDPGWNITKKTNNTSVTTYTINNLNQVTSSGGTYDGNGNRTYYNNLDYAYDDENQLIYIHATNSNWKVDFTYDGRQRLRKRVESNWGGSWTVSSETRYIYDGMNVIQERNSSNVPTVTYARGTDLSGTLQGAGGIGGILARVNGYNTGTGAWSTHNHYHADGNGNITAIVDSTPSQSLVATYRFNPFGGTISSSGSLASANLYRFSSKEIHVNSALYYYGHRFYDPSLQRWVNRDPIQEDGGVNLYAFNSNDSIDAYDPFGFAQQGKPPPPKWDPDRWQKNRENCCAYAYDKPGGVIRPGETGGFPKYPDWDKGGYTCKEIRNRVRGDFGNDPNVGVPKKDTCPEGYHKIKLWVQPDGKDFHMQRQDRDGKWSEMPWGSGPKKCNPKNPNKEDDVSCGEMCVPNSAAY